MSNKSLRYIANTIKAGLFILPAVALFVSNQFFFPFITTKGFLFRTIVEILFFLWVFIAVFDKKYRPKITPVLMAVAITLFVLTLSAIFGENLYRSFWSNYERMEGLVTHLHLFAYFLILVSVLKKPKDFKIFFGAIVLASVVMTGYGLMQLTGKVATHQGDRIDGTLGNSSYMAIYMIFNMFFAGLLFYWFKQLWLRIALVILVVLEFIIMYYTATRGAILGFFAGAGLFALLMAILGKNKKTKYVAGGVIGILLILLAVFFAVKDTAYVKEHPVLSRLASISATETTVESRFTIWRMSIEGFKEHPVLGWGIENYSLVFAKYFKPIMWKQEPWFDRSHNIVFDWLISAGALGLLSYIGIFISSLYVLWRGFKRKIISLVEAAGITALFGAYTFHNLFVFDNLISYLLFFGVLAFVHFRSTEDKNEKEKDNSHRSTANNDLSLNQYALITITFLVVLFSLYVVNVKPMLANTTLIKALYATKNDQTSVDNTFALFKKALSYDTFGNTEVREQLSSFTSQVYSAQGISDATKLEILNYAIEQAEKQVEKDPDNVRNQVQLGALLGKTERFKEAENAFKKALELSPNKQQLYFAFADIYLARGMNEEAFNLLDYAYKLDTNYQEAGRLSAVGAIISGKQAYADEVLTKTFGTTIIPNRQMINVYARVSDYERVKDTWLAIIENDPSNPQDNLSLAATYVQLEEREKAIAEIEKVVALHPDFRAQADYYISEIRAGRNP